MGGLKQIFTLLWVAIWCNSLVYVDARQVPLRGVDPKRVAVIGRT